MFKKMIPLYIIILSVSSLSSNAVNTKGQEHLKQTTLPPTGLMCELLAMPARTLINDSSPEFSWIVNSFEKNDVQIAYQILVSSCPDTINKDMANMWDSGKVQSNQSTNVEYGGKALQSNCTYYWKVRTWDRQGRHSPYSVVQKFRTGQLSSKHTTACYPLEKREVPPVRIARKKPGHIFIDFGKAAFGTVKLMISNQLDDQQMEIHLGEVPESTNSIKRKTRGSRRYRKIIMPLKKGTHTYIVDIPPDERNTGEYAIKMPEQTGEVLSFRYCELVGPPGHTEQAQVHQIAVNYPFDDNASDFRSSSKILNDVWDLCKYSMKATSFCGVFVDGDRERIPYEADAYINQLGYYCVEREFTIARHTYEYLVKNATWAFEWPMQTILMAWADYLNTANTESLQAYYDDLKPKTFKAIAREDGLIDPNLITKEFMESIHLIRPFLNPIVDWPQAGTRMAKGGPGETDGFEFKPINTVINAYHYRTLVLMSWIAEALGKMKDAQNFAEDAANMKKTFNEKLLDTDASLYIDGIGSKHSALHSNMFPIEFDMAPNKYINTMTEFIKTRGMACSVYGAQHLLEALYKAGEDDYALSLMASTAERSWAHMIYDVGTTISLEAWDNRFKPNQDWNHAWGAAPANIIPRWLMGVQPLEPAFSKISIKPQPGSLDWATLDMPTIKGTIHVDFQQQSGVFFKLNINIPANTTAKVYIPCLAEKDRIVIFDGEKQKAEIEGRFLYIDNVGSGDHAFETRAKY